MSLGIYAQGHEHDGHNHSGHNHAHAEEAHDHHTDDHETGDHRKYSTCGHHEEGYDATSTAMHHISDANVYTIFDWIRIPLPCIVYSDDAGWDVFMSSVFDPGHHDDGHYAHNGYVMHQGSIKRIVDDSFPKNESHIAVGGFMTEEIEVDGSSKQITKVCFNEEKFLVEPRSTLDGGIMGGGITSFYDFSITKNVMTMIIVSLLLFFFLRKAALAYSKREGQAPKGVQSLFEVVVVYIRDEVAVPFIGEHRYKSYMSLLLSIFFFILGLNLWGQVPFFGGPNVTGNLAVTMVLAIIVFFVTNFNGNKHYWGHIFWMPGVPTFVKPLLALIEGMSLFIKPLTLMLRLAGNITAGHIAILSFIGLIFIFGESGKFFVGGVIGAILSTILTIFMMSIELLVAFIQAFVFTLLTASYIGAATEEHGHEHH